MKINSTSCEIYLYAVDTAIIFTVDNETELQRLNNDFVINYSSWCLHNCMAVNSTKSNFLSLNTNDISVTINGYVIIKTNVAKYLGLFIDDSLSWSYYVNYKTKSICQKT